MFCINHANNMYHFGRNVCLNLILDTSKKLAVSNKRRVVLAYILIITHITNVSIQSPVLIKKKNPKVINNIYCTLKSHTGILTFFF